MQPQPTTTTTFVPNNAGLRGLKVFRRQECAQGFGLCNGSCLSTEFVCCGSGYCLGGDVCRTVGRVPKCCPSVLPNPSAINCRPVTPINATTSISQSSPTSQPSNAFSTPPALRSAASTPTSTSTASEQASSNPSSSSTTSHQAASPSSSNLPKIIGPVVGVVVLLALGLIFFCWRQHQRRSQHSGAVELEANSRAELEAIPWTGAEKRVDTEEAISHHHHPVVPIAPVVAAPGNIPSESTRTEPPQESPENTTAIMTAPQRYDSVVGASPRTVPRPDSPSDELEWIEEEERKARERMQALQDLRSLREAEARMESEQNRLRENEKRLTEG